MRFPWLQVDADFIGAHAGDLGSMLGISRREAIGLAVDLWTWALARARDDAPPDGIVTGTGAVPDRLLAGSVGWTGPVEQFTEALVAVGMAVRIEGGYRLTGFSRYRATWEKNRRRTGEKPERNRTGTAEEPVRKTQTQTQTQKEETTLSAPPEASPQTATETLALALGSLPAPEEAAKKPSRRKQPAVKREPTGDPRHAPLVAALVEAHRGPKGAPYGFAGGRDAKAVTELLALADQNPETSGDKAPAEILRRWEIALEWVGFPACTSLTAFRDNWNAYAQPQKPKATGDRPRLGPPAAPPRVSGDRPRI